MSDFTEKDRFLIGLNWYRRGNFDVAKKFWSPLAENGDCDSEYAMGLLYYSGAGVRRDYANAIRLWTSAGGKGQPQAQLALGAAYSRLTIPFMSLSCKSGCGVDKDLTSAYKWFSLVVKTGSPIEVRAGEKSIIDISDKLSSEQIKKAKLELAEWEPSPSACTSRGILLAAPKAASAFY